MTFLKTKTGIALVILIGIAILVFLQSAVFGGTFVNLTINTNQNLENGLTDHVAFDVNMPSNGAGPISGGDMLWATATDPTAFTDTALANASDGTDVYVTGYCTGCGSQGGAAIYTFKVDGNNGDMLWATTTDPTSSSDQGTGIASDGTNAYVFGYCTGCGPRGNTAMYTMKVDGSNGAMLWATTTDPTSSSDQSYGIASDGTNMYATGSCFGCGSKGSSAFYTMKIDPSSGAMLWSTTTDPTSSSDSPLGIATDGTDTYVTGICFGCGSPGNQAIYTMKVDGSNGDMLWATTTDPSSQTDYGFGIALVGTNAYVTGYCQYCGSKGGSAPYTFKVAGSDDPNNLTPTAGKIGQAVELDGSSDYIDEGDIGSANTIAFWIKRTTTGAEKLINIDGTDQIEINGSNQVVATSFPAATVYIDGSTASNVINDKDWHHITVVDTTGVSASTFEVGRVSSSYFNGSIDDVRAYNRVLSISEIERLYELGGTTHINKTLNVNPDLENGLVGHWSFDGDLTSSVADSSGTGNASYLYTNGEATSTKIDTGVMGQALQFDGVDDYLNSNAPSGLPSGASARTMSMWVKYSGYQDGKVFGGYGKENFNGQNFQIGHSNSNTIADRIAVFVWGPNDWESNVVASAYGDDTFHNFLVTYDGATLKLYIDGEYKDSVSKTLNTNVDDLCIGGEVASGACDRWLDGTVDDVRIYDRVLSNDEIKRLYELGGTTHVNTSVETNPDLKSGLVGHWAFDGDLIPSIPDSSGQGNTGYIATGGAATSSKIVPGEIGQGLNFDASNNDYVNIGTGSSLNMGSGDYTVAIWAKYATTSSSFPVFVGKGDSIAGGKRYAIFGRPNGALECDNDDDTVDTSYFSSRAYDDNKWHHIVCVRSGSTLYMYIDDIAEPSYDASGLGNLDDSKPGLIGSLYNNNNPNASLFEGSIDDVRIYNRALSASEVKRLYDLGR